MSSDCEKVNEKCSLLETLHLLGKKWSVFLIAELYVHENRSFAQLQHSIKDMDGTPISSRILSQALKELQEQGVVERVVSDSKPTRVNYFLSEKGEDLAVILAAAKAWGIKWGGAETKVCRSFTCIHNSVPILDLKDLKTKLYTLDPIGRKISFVGIGSD